MKKWNKIFKRYLIMDANYLIDYISKCSNPSQIARFFVSRHLGAGVMMYVYLKKRFLVTSLVTQAPKCRYCW